MDIFGIGVLEMKRNNFIIQKWIIFNLYNGNSTKIQFIKKEGLLTTQTI